MIINSGRNSIHNIKNPYQGIDKKVLCICSAGLLRSPTTAFVLHKEFGFNTRAAGLQDYALIPVSEALLLWADEIVVMENYQLKELKSECKEMDIDIEKKKVISLNIPDMFNYMDEKLQQMILSRYKENFII